MVLAAPERGRLGAGRGRGHVRLHRREQPTEHALGRPVEQRDLAAWTADAHELVGCLLVVRSEHHADRRHHDVERCVGERQMLGVGLRPVERESGLVGAGAPGLEQLGGQVARDDAGAALGGMQRRVAGAGGDVEHLLAGGDAGGIDETRPEGEQERLDHRRVVARRPHRAVLRLDLRIGGRGWCLCRHSWPPGELGWRTTVRLRPVSRHRETVPILGDG
jgi:hypothetical protein